MEGRAGGEGAGRDYFLSALQADYKLQLYSEGDVGFGPVLRRAGGSLPGFQCCMDGLSGAERRAAGMEKWLHGSVERIVMSVCQSLELLPLSMVLLSVKHV